MNMCEFLDKLDLADWVDVAQMLIAGFSAYLLFRTFKKQGENEKRQIELANMEKKAKRATFLPYLEASIEHWFPLSSGLSPQPDFTKDEVTKIEILLNVKGNALQIYDVEFTNFENKHIQSEISHFSFFEKTISTPGTPIRLTHTVNFRRFFEDVGDEMLFDRVNNLTIRSRVFFMDMIGNRYSVDVFVNGISNEVDMRDIEIIEEKKPAN